MRLLNGSKGLLLNAFIAAAIFTVSPTAARAQGPWVISGSVTPADGTTENCVPSFGVDFSLTLNGNTVVEHAGTSPSTCTYATFRDIGSGTSASGTASVYGYLPDTEPPTPLTVNSDATLNFHVYCSFAWVRGSITDSSSGLAIPSNDSLSIYATLQGGSGQTNAAISGASFQFGPSPGQCSPGNGLPVTRPQGMSNGAGTATYLITASANNYSTSQFQVTLTSGEIAALNIALFPVSPNPSAGGPPRQCEPICGSPIDLTTGNTWIQQQDYSLPGLGGGISLARTWNSVWPALSPPVANGMFGQSWRSSYEEQLVRPSARNDTLEYWRSDGSAWIFLQDPTTLVYTVASPLDQHTTLTFDTTSSLYTMTFLDGSKRQFTQVTGQNQGGLLSALLDRNGNKSTLTYDASNRLTKVKDASNRTLNFNYGTGAQANLVTSISDSVGTFSSYQYDTSSRLTQVSYPDGSALNFLFDASNNITSVTDVNAKVIETHTYDTQHRGVNSSRAQVNGTYQETVTVSYGSNQVTLTDSQNHTTNYSFVQNAAQKYISQITGSGCATCGGRGNTTFTYGGSSNRVAVLDANSDTTNYTYDDSGNLLTRSITLNSSPVIWTYTYNGFGEVLAARDPLGNTTMNAYDTKGNLLTTTTPPPGSGQQGLTTTFTYDSLGELTTVTDPRSHLTTISYFSNGLISSITDAQNNVTSFTYDGRGNRLTAVDALNKTTSFTYDAMNRLTKITYPDNTTAQFAYDTRGRRTSVTDGNGKVTTYAYDDADRLTSVTDAASNVTGYGYDTESNLNDITDAKNNNTTFMFDSLGRVTTVTFPSTLLETYTYDGLGNLLTKKDRNGNTITYTYDALNRLTQKKYPDQTTVAYTYDAASRLTQVVDPTGTYLLSYDGLGRLNQSTTTYSFLTGRNLTVAYTYDAASNRVTMTDAEGGQTTYAYDTLNRLSNLTDFSNHQFTFGYDALSRRTSLTRPNGVNTTYNYDALSRLLSLAHQNGTTTLDSFSYTYDNAGNRTSLQKPSGATPWNYTYDAIYELTKSVRGTTTKETYGYDAVGNRTSSLSVPSYTYNSSNELTAQTGVTYTYDNNGNQLTKVAGSSTTSFAWDFENRLTSVTLPGSGGTVTFKYDPFGRRIQKVSSVGTSIYVYDGDNQIEEVNASGTAVARYTQGLGIDEPLAMLRGTTTNYYHADGLGSILDLSDSTGHAVNAVIYDTFGNFLDGNITVTNPFRYTAREFDTETGLYFYRARYYDPSAGRFLSEDPFEFGAGINFYSYVANNPVNLTDPSGLLQLCCRPAKSVTWLGIDGCHCFLLLSDGHTYGAYFHTPPFLTPGRDDPDDNPRRGQPGTWCRKLPASTCQEDKIRSDFQKIPTLIYAIDGTSNTVPADLLNRAGFPNQLPPCAIGRGRTVQPPLPPLPPYVRMGTWHP